MKAIMAISYFLPVAVLWAVWAMAKWFFEWSWWVTDPLGFIAAAATAVAVFVLSLVS